MQQLPTTLIKFGTMLVDQANFPHAEAKDNNHTLADWLAQVYDKAHGEYQFTLEETLEALRLFMIVLSNNMDTDHIQELIDNDES